MSVKDSPVKGGTAKGSAVKGSAVTAGGARPKAMDRSDRQAAADGRALGLGTGWTVFSYLIGGMAAYGGIGWLIGRAVHVSLLFPIGMLVGMGISLGYIIYRFGKQQGQGGLGGKVPPQERGAPGGRPPGSTQKEMTGDR
jgi:ATP synthase protein I